MHAGLARRTPGWPLLATLGVHLLLAWSWRIAHPPAPGPGGERVIDLIPVPSPARMPRVRAEPLSSRSSAAVPRSRSAAVVPNTARNTVRNTARGPAPEAAPIVLPPEAPSTVADPFAIAAPQAAADTALDTMAGRARRDALLIDRTMRKGRSGVPDTADTAWGRFGQALEDAHKDRGLGVTSETYTAPDGQVIYRFRRGGRFKCRSGGSVGPNIGGAVGGGAVLFDVQGGGGRAGQVSCPSHADWKPD